MIVVQPRARFFSELEAAGRGLRSTKRWSPLGSVFWSGSLGALLLAGCSGAESQKDAGIAAAQVSQPVVSGAESIAMGPLHACAVSVGGRLKCWGWNGAGQLGLGDVNNRGDAAGEMGTLLPEIDLGSGARARKLALGAAHTCALLDDGRVKCWGSGAYGQTGLALPQVGDEPGEMGDQLPAVDLGTGRTATAIAAGNEHTCAVLDNATLKCWGNNSHGQLGYGDTQPRGTTQATTGDNLPVVDLPGPVLSVAAGLAHTCAILEGGDVYCWGSNAYGQLGLGDTEDRGDQPGEMGAALPRVPTHGGAHHAMSLALGDLHSCALIGPEERVRCWGSNTYGQLGQGNGEALGDDPGEAPAHVTTGGDVAQLSAGAAHTCVLRKVGKIRCFGRNNWGQLGYDDTENRGDEPDEMQNLKNVRLGSTLVAVGAGADYSCGLREDSSIRCWGRNNMGQLGLGNTLTVGDEPGEMATLKRIDLSPLRSDFMGGDPEAHAVFQGMPYQMDDPNLYASGSNDFNHDVFAFKILAALNVLGFNTNMDYVYGVPPHIEVLNKYQRERGFAEESVLRANVLAKLDQDLAARDSFFNPYAKGFLHFAHMAPLAKNEAPQRFVASLFRLGFEVLPAYLRPSEYESAQCLAIQCYGTVRPAPGLPGYPLDINQPYEFVGGYYSDALASWYPSAPTNLHTILHEYAHYLDGLNRDPTPTQPLHGVIETAEFHDLTYEPGSGCRARLSDDPRDFVSRYGFQGNSCGNGLYHPSEEFADAFAYYVTAGRHFRNAAASRALIQQQYDWLRDNVFQGVEYDTDLPAALDSGCNDVPNGTPDYPAYFPCDYEYVWDFTLPLLQ